MENLGLGYGFQDKDNKANRICFKINANSNSVLISAINAF